jgi:hypothetical protein
VIREFCTYSLLLLATACSIEPVIPLQPLPAPAMEKLPVHVVLVTDDAFRSYKFDGPLFSGAPANDPMWKNYRLRIELGEMNVDLFRQVSSSLFAQVTRFDSMEELKASGESFDGVLVPALEHFDAGWRCTSPAVCADVTYELLLFDQHEQQILDWKVVSQQSSCQGVIFCRDTYKNIMLAVERDIAAKILSQFPGFPEITDWVKSVQAGR